MLENVQPLSVRRGASRTSRKHARFIRILLHDKFSFAAIVFLILLIIASLAGNVLVNLGILHDPYRQNLLLRNTPPGVDADGVLRLLGTDQLGRDILARLVFGLRISLSVGAATVILTMTIGVVLGLVSGFYRGIVDDVVMRLVDVQMGFPTLMFAMIVLYAAGAGFANLVLVLALTRWMLTARVVRAMTISLRESPFIEAAQTLGASDARIMARHVLPNVFSTALSLGAIEFSQVLLSAAALSFLGLGIQPPAASWGLMLAEGRDYVTTAWWVVAFPGLAICLTTLSANTLAAWLQVVTDPSQRSLLLQQRQHRPMRLERSQG